jgi:hypothetical protein
MSASWKLEEGAAVDKARLPRRARPFTYLHKAHRVNFTLVSVLFACDLVDAAMVIIKIISGPS